MLIEVILFFRMIEFGENDQISFLGSILFGKG